MADTDSMSTLEAVISPARERTHPVVGFWRLAKQSIVFGG
jgi:hypothetical protein